MAPQASTAQTDPLRAAARCIALDLATADVVRRLHDAGAAPLLLKGPGLARLLYDPGELRAYSDVDLLVAPGDLTATQTTLSAAGFRRPDWDEWPLDHHQVWVCRTRDVPVTIELHRSFHGLRADERVVWRELSRDRVRIDVGGAQVAVPSPAVCALLVALHAGGHGKRASASLRDLDRALERLSDGVWTQAAAVAARLDATGAMATGLGLRPRGAALASRLALQPARSLDLLLLADGAPSGIVKLARMRGPMAKARLAARVVLPTPAQMRRLYGERHGLRLVLAYVRRTAQLACTTLRAAPACLRLARRSG